ncbi:FeoA family protein [Anaerolentibacter hominis]|uniref:FeoA family protein n=1 Tax=Anaerolentibacter hominis TaxID=3079009 RepID=UPI0031B89329
MTILDGSVGKGYTVAGIRLKPDTARRLQVLGLTQGTRVDILNRKKRGAVIIKIRGTRFAVGRQIAGGILVKEEQA